LVGGSTPEGRVAAGGRLQTTSLNNGGNMIKNAFKMFLTLCFFVVMGHVAAKAQITSDTPIEANIPHPFIINNTTLPAGKYVVKTVDDNELTVLEIRSADDRTAVIFETITAQANQPMSRSELVFNKVGDKYFLSQVWLEGIDTGNQVLKSKTEKKLEDVGASSEKHSVAAKKTNSKQAKKSS
jgi:hypothetical protein